MNNLALQILLFSFGIVMVRFLLGIIQIDFRYLIDIALFLCFFITTFLNLKKNNKKRCLEFYFSIVIAQIISSVILFEIVKMMIYSPKLSIEYFHQRMFVFAYIFILGLLSSGISVLIFCRRSQKRIHHDLVD